MATRRSQLFALLLPALLAAAPATKAAETCNLRQVASVDLLLSPTTNALFMPVSINGTNKIMLVDTGGIFSTLSPQIASELGLKRHPSPVQMVNVAGQIFNTVAEVERFSFANLRPTRIEFLLHPPYDRTAAFGGDIVGTIAPSILKHYDVEFDLAAAKMNLFEPSRCANAAYWSTGNAAAVKMDVLESGHIVFPMVLDGHTVMAALDTGMTTTALDLGTALKTFGVNPDAPGEAVDNLTGHADGMVYARTFRSLATEGGEITINNPKVNLLPNIKGSARRNTIQPALILGLSILKRLHFYIAYRQQMLYFTVASGPPAVTLHSPLLSDPAPQVASSPNTAPYPHAVPSAPADTDSNSLADKSGK